MESQGSFKSGRQKQIKESDSWDVRFSWPLLDLKMEQSQRMQAAYRSWKGMKTDSF